LLDAFREWDKCWTFDNDALILLPQTDAAGALVALERIVALAASADIRTGIRITTFPDDAPTANGMMSQLFDTLMEQSA